MSISAVPAKIKPGLTADFRSFSSFRSGPKARTCDYGWVLNTHIQCVEYGVPFHFHQTGARLRRSVPDGHGGHILKIYEIPREYQHTQAEKAGLDYGGGIEIPACLSADSLSICKEPEEEGSN